MSYEYNLSITNITVNNIDQIIGINIIVNESLLLMDISTLEFTITSIQDGNIIPYTINPNNNLIVFDTPLSHEIAIAIQAINSILLKSSNIVLVDFKKEFINGSAVFLYTTPNVPGNYTISIKSPDGISVPSLSQNLIITENIDPNRSSITYDKSYLPQKTNQILELKVILKDSSGNLISGIEELQLTTTKNT